MMFGKVFEMLDWTDYKLSWEKIRESDRSQTKLRQKNHLVIPYLTFAT